MIKLNLKCIDPFKLNMLKLSLKSISFENNNKTNNSKESNTKGFTTNTNYYYYIKEIDESKNPLVFYQSKYNFSYEKALINASFIFAFISSTTMLSNTYFVLKVINFIVFCPSVFVIIDYFSGYNKFISQARLLSSNTVEFIDMKNKKFIYNISELSKVIDSANESKSLLNHQLYFILKINKQKGYLNLPRDCTLLNEELFEDIISGKRLI